ncbi:MAG: M10 family metallopeptidase C-terminal domain-containing protein [Hyphomicrobiaceae bacterium]|nr:M10 family metallopeptidase C-terminal domain-containing protein [Hyphomicrobiaceae bacterium]
MGRDSAQCSAVPGEDNFTFAAGDGGTAGFDPAKDPAYGETWAEWFEAPAGPHFEANAVGYMTANSTFDGAIGYYGDYDFIRIELQAGKTYTIQAYSFSMQPFVGIFGYTGTSGSTVNAELLQTQSFEQVVVNGTLYFVSTQTFTADSHGTFWLAVKDNEDDTSIGAYTLGVVEDETPAVLKNWTTKEIAHRLTDTGWEFFGGERRIWEKTNISYNVDGLTNSVKKLVKHAFDAWEASTGLNFTKTSGGADITFDDTEPDKAYTHSDLKNNGNMKKATINIGRDFDKGTTLDSYTFQSLIHEIGHALGLAHAGDYNAGQGGPTTYPDSALFRNDSWNATIMSYINQSMNTKDKADYALIMTPMIADVVAMFDLYGKPASFNKGNTVYGFHSNVGNYLDVVFDYLVEGDTSSNLIDGSQPLSFTILDSKGNDTINFKTDTRKQTVDLQPGHLSKVYGVAGSMVIANGTFIETYIAGKNDDKVTGNKVANVLRGMNGDDNLKGLDGNDRLFGGNNNDVLEGGPGKDVLDGGKGKDKLTGNSGADFFVYGKGSGRDRVMDFKDDVDALKLDDALWKSKHGNLSKSQVIQKFAQTKNGDAVFDFGGGDVLKVDGIAKSHLTNDLVIV